MKERKKEKKEENSKRVNLNRAVTNRSPSGTVSLKETRYVDNSTDFSDSTKSQSVCLLNGACFFP